MPVSLPRHFALLLLTLCAEIVSLFVSTSIPWMEARQLKRRGAAFAAYQREVPVLLPVTLW